MRKFVLISVIALFVTSEFFLSCNNGSERIVYVTVPASNNDDDVNSYGGGTQSGVITSVNESTIVEEIKKMTESGTVKASGLFDSKLIEDVKNAIDYLADERPNVLVTLDLSAVKGLSKFSFKNCKRLVGIVLPNDKTNMTSIGQSAFSGCTRLASVTISSSVRSIGSYAFHDCAKLTNVTIPSSVTSIGSCAFSGCTGLTNVAIPSSVTSIGSSAFEGCSRLASVTIPSSVTSIGSYAFKDCAKLKNVEIPSSMTSVGRAFSECTGLESVTIPSSVTSIYDYAFSGCTGLASVTISDSVTKIGSYVFEGCTGLTNCNYTGTLVQWCKISFSNPNSNPCFYTKKLCIQGQEIVDLEIPTDVTSIGAYAFSGCTGLINCNYTGTLAQWCNISFNGNSSNPCFYTKKLCIQGQEIVDLEIPTDVTSIGNYAFSGCAGLASVTIPDSVTSIGNHAFSGCTGLASVTIPTGVTSIGDCAFSRCGGLTSVTISGSVTKIGSYAFEDCGGLTSVTIPIGVTKIGKYSFWNCGKLKNAIFSDVSGWYYTSNMDYTDGVAIGSVYLSDSANAAERLKIASGYHYKL